MKNNLFIAVLLSLSGLFLLDCMGIAIKYLREDYPAAQLSVFRNLFGMLPCFIALYFSQDWHNQGKKVAIKQLKSLLSKIQIKLFAIVMVGTEVI